MNPTKLPSGSWRLLVYLGKDKNGKRIYHSVTHVNKRECIRIANELAQHHHDITRDASKMTLREGIDAYIAMKDNILSPSTIRGYYTVRDHHMQQEMDMPLYKLTNNIVQAAINREAATYSPKTLTNVYGLVSSVLRQFTRTELHITMPKGRKTKTHVLTEDEMRTLIAALNGHPAEIPLLLAMFLGLRASEIAGIKPEEDYNPQTHVLTIQRALVPDKDNNYVEKGPKSEAGERSIPVPEYLAVKLDKCVAEGRPFCTIRQNNLSRTLKRVCENSGVTPIRLHDLRHQNASIMLLFAPDKYAMERGGWSTNFVMKNIYQHTITSERAKLDQNMNDYFNNLANYTPSVQHDVQHEAKKR